MRYISLWFYGNEAYNINQWKDVDSIKCDREEESECLNSGKEVLDFYAFDVVGRVPPCTQVIAALEPLVGLVFQNHLWLDIGLLVVMAVVTRVLGYLALVVRSRRTSALDEAREALCGRGTKS